MRQKDDMVHVDQFPRHVRLIGEHVEPGAQDPPPAKRRHQSRFVDERAARHIDENSIWAQGVENFRIDDIVGFGTSGRDDDEQARGLCKLTKSRIIIVGDASLAVSAMIGDGQSEGLCPLGDGFADTSQAKDSEPSAAQARRQRKASLEPFSRPHEAIGLRNLADCRDQKSDREIGHLFGEDIGRIRDDDLMRRCPFGIDTVVADAHMCDDFQLWKLPHEVSIDPHGGERATDEAANPIFDSADQAVGIIRLP